MTDAVEIVSDLVKIPSVSPFGRNETERRERFERCREVLAYLEEFLQKQGAQTEQLVFEGGHDKWWYPVPNLYAELTIGDRKAAGHKFLCYIGHIDVVPVGEEKLWRRPPFSGQVDEGFVWGRGATDMKGSVGAWMSALEKLKAGKGDGVNLTIGTLITGDEEWAAVNGSDKVLAWMKANGKNPDAFIVGEPSSRDYLGTHVKTGRRGSLVGYLEAKGTQGHRAYEELFENPNRALVYAMVILNAKRWKDGSRHFPNTTFETVALRSGDFAASAVIPETAGAMWNVRFTSRQSKEKVLADLQEILLNPPRFLRRHPDYAKAREVIVRANMETASEPYYSEPGSLAQSALEAIRASLRIEAQTDGSGGTTDGRFIGRYFPRAQIIELGTPEKGGIVDGKPRSDYGRRGGMHQIDERAAQRDLRKVSEIYALTLKNFAMKEY